MPKKEITNQEIYEKLEEVRRLISSQLAAFKLVNMKEIEAARVEVLKIPIRKKIYDLVDNKRAVTQIAQEAFKGENEEKSVPKVSYHLAILEDYNMISHRDDKGQRFYYKIRE
jgi:DNA-binding transcriptional ArsR family regulator